MHEFDNNLRFTGNSNPLTSAYTCGANAKLLVVGIVTGGPVPRDGGAPTYNGVELTQADETRQWTAKKDITVDASCELWYLSEPGVSSAYTISIPNPNSLLLHVQVSSYSVSSGYTSELDDDNGNVATSASPSLSLTTTEVGDVIVAVLASGENWLPTSLPIGSLNASDNGDYCDANQYALQTVPGAYSTGWTTQTYDGNGPYGAGIYNGTDGWAMCVAAFKEVNSPITVEPTALALTLSLLIPSIDIDDSPTIIHTASVLTLTLNAPTIATSETSEPDMFSGTFALKAPTVVIDFTLYPDALALPLSLKLPSIAIQQNVTVLHSAIALSISIESPNTLGPLDTVRMMPFIYSSTIAYPIEFGEKYARFYYDGEPLLGDGDVHVEIDTPFESSDLYQLQTRQIADVMWCVHPSYLQKKLKRTDPYTFTLEDIVFDKGPFLERNDIAEDDDVTMNVNVTDVDDNGILTASSSTFEDGHVGSIFKLTHPRVNRQTNGSKTGTETGIIGDPMDVLGDYTFSITSTGWAGTVRLQRSTDDWVTHTNIVSYTSGIRTYEGTEKTAGVQYRIMITAHTRNIISASLSEHTSAVSGSAKATGVIGVPLDIKGDFNFNTHGNWGATTVLERNEDNAGWEPYRTYISVVLNGAGDRNVQFAGTEEADNVQYRINVTKYTTGTVEADLQATSSTQSGIVRINEVVSSTEANITIVSKISQTTDTKRWAEGAWSDVRGYPAAIGLFEERIIYGGTENNPNRIWLSASGKFEDFEAGIKAADSFSLDMASTNIIKWIAALEALAIGHGGEEFRIRASELDEPLTPTDFSIRKQTAFGSTNIQAIEVGSAILFVDSVGRRVREFTYRDDAQKYVSPDLTALAEHITTSGIVCFAHQKNPDSILWCVLENGGLISLSYNREQNVTAWARHPIDGLVQSVAIVPSSSEDEVWLSVVRSTNGSNKIYVEKFHSRYLDIRKENSFFVDCGIIYSGPAITDITGLDHIEGKIVAILADGEVLAEQRVEDGKVILSTPAFNVRCGIPYISQATPMRMDMNLASGSTYGSIKKISEIVFSFHDTLNAQYGTSESNLKDIDWTDPKLKNTSKIEGLFTGDITVALDGGFDTDDIFIISQSDPLPCTVRAIIPRVEKTGR